MSRGSALPMKVNYSQKVADPDGDSQFVTVYPHAPTTMSVAQCVCGHYVGLLDVIKR